MIAFVVHDADISSSMRLCRLLLVMRVVGTAAVLADVAMVLQVCLVPKQEMPLFTPSHESRAESE